TATFKGRTCVTPTLSSSPSVGASLCAYRHPVLRIDVRNSRIQEHFHPRSHDIYRLYRPFSEAERASRDTCAGATNNAKVRADVRNSCKGRSGCDKHNNDGRRPTAL